MIEVNILANVGEMDHGAEPISFRTICLMPDKLERKHNGARIKFSIEPMMHHFGCEGVIIDGLKLKQKQKPTPHIESLEFVPFGKTSFDTQLAFIQACMRVIIESSILTPNAKEKPSKMKLCIVREDTIRRMEGLVENAIGSLSEDANVEVKVFSPTDQTDFSSDASPYISSNLEQILNLSRSGKIKHFYLLYEAPNECKNQNKIMYDGPNRDKFMVLYEQEFDKKKLSFFKELNDELEPLIYHIDNNNNWRSCVEDLNSNKTLQDKRVHLVFWGLIEEDLHLVTREVLRICSIFHPRCFFVHDDVATVNSEYDRIWKEQMKRDMNLNVFQNGKWGTWLRNTVPKTDFIHQLSEKARNAGASSQIDMKYLSLDEIYLKNLEDQAMILGYSGIAASGEDKMGLAHRNEDVDEIILDPILQWTVPKHISLKDAASIPLAYLMANLIIRDEFCRQLGRKRVLVHNGNTPTGIACIAVALIEGHTVYTTVPDDVRREYVRRIFPQVHILDASCLTQAEFLVPFMLTTDGQGFEIIISDLPEEQFLASWNFVARGGFLVNLNESLPARSVPLPMNGFLKNVSVFSLSKRSISLLPPHRKQRLHGLVDEFLRSGKVIMIPHRPLSEDMALSQSFSGEMELKSSNKLLLKILDFEAKHNGILSNVTKRSKISAPCKSDGCYIILGANDKRLSTVIKWLLKHGAKNILLASSQNRNGLLRQVSDWAVNRGATLLFSGFTDPSLKGAQEILQKASKLGKLSAVFSVASAQNNEAVHNINQIMLERNISAPVISVRDKNDQFLPNIINVVCDGNVNFSDVLRHALATRCNSTVYHVTEKSNTILQQNNSQTSVTKTHSDKFTDYLPCSLNELNNIGKLLSAKDYESESGVYGKFFPTASLAPQKQLHRDVRPIFIIPAFCETQLRPLMAKLMYRCFVAHVCLNVPSLNQLASHLLKSMMQIQKRGPYTIVAETWSGGVATTLSTLISDAGHEVSLFLIQGVPQKMTSLLPSQDLLGGCLVQHLFQEIKANEELKSLDSALEMLSNSVHKLYAQRAFHAILQTMVLLQSFNCATLHRDTLTLIELGCTCELKMSELKKMSEKTVRLVKSDSKTYKDMLKDPLISNTINDEALFSWHTY
nr:PREDICTED: uncharacterized protein LOC109030309 [Bemisia tabaci]